MHGAGAGVCLGVGPAGPAGEEGRPARLRVQTEPLPGPGRPPPDRSPAAGPDRAGDITVLAQENSLQCYTVQTLSLVGRLLPEISPADWVSCLSCLLPPLLSLLPLPAAASLLDNALALQPDHAPALLAGPVAGGAGLASPDLATVHHTLAWLATSRSSTAVPAPLLPALFARLEEPDLQRAALAALLRYRDLPGGPGLLEHAAAIPHPQRKLFAKLCQANKNEKII